MPGQKRFSPKLFYNINLEQMVPWDHVLRRFDSLIELDFLYGETRPHYRHTGQPSVDPVVLFKMMLLGYLYGISSERKLAQEIQVNVVFRRYRRSHFLRVGLEILQFKQAFPAFPTVSNNRIHFSRFL